MLLLLFSFLIDEHPTIIWNIGHWHQSINQSVNCIEAIDNIQVYGLIIWFDLMIVNIKLSVVYYKNANNYCYNISTYLPTFSGIPLYDKSLYIFSYDWQQQKKRLEILKFVIDCRPMKTLNEEKRYNFLLKSLEIKSIVIRITKIYWRIAKQKKLKLFLMLEFNQNNP